MKQSIDKKLIELNTIKSIFGKQNLVENCFDKSLIQIKIRRINYWNKLYLILSIILGITTFTCLELKIFELINFDLNKGALMIFFTLISIVHYYNYKSHLNNLKMMLFLYELKESFTIKI